MHACMYVFSIELTRATRGNSYRAVEAGETGAACHDARRTDQPLEISNHLADVGDSVGEPDERGQCPQTRGGWDIDDADGSLSGGGEG